MRVLLSVVMLLGVAGSAFAQATHEVRPKPDTTAAQAAIAGSSGCWPVTSRDRVVVRMDDGPARTGTLLCMGPEEIVLTGSGTLPLSTILKIEKPRDSTLDGMLKGAAVGLIIAALCAGECEAEYVVRATLGYAAIGGAIDALQGNNKTIYRREPVATVAWRVRF
ncbi:MAG TPA: hypothetical protein VKA59_11970 [Vicinamibacterales bacterium]|nr:hypothetical protein [Vicinamibacterales bacterium]